eukprot:jgi/Mesvir1/28149/Mv04714-RA.2
MGWQISKSEDARSLLRHVLQGELVDAIITTLYNDMFMEPLLAAIGQHIPVYVVGTTHGLQLGKLRRAASGADSAGLIQPTLVNVGIMEETLSSQLASRLLARGFQRVDCIYSNDQNVAFRERCRAVAQAFRDAGKAGKSHVNTRAFVPMVIALSALAEEIDASENPLAANETALILMDTVMYSIVKEVKQGKGVLVDSHVVVFESSVEILTDIRNGAPVTFIDQHTYSQGYAAVALAAYELQTGEALAADVSPTPRFYSAGMVTAEDIAREVCRQEGFPVCGNPGVLDVSPKGCPCFNRSSVLTKVISTLPIVAEPQKAVLAGMEDAMLDFPGTSYEWNLIPDVGVSTVYSTSDTYAAVRQGNWTNAVHLDHFLAQVDPKLMEAMRVLGAAKRNRTYWLTTDRDSDHQSISQFLARFNADGFMGPSPQAWPTAGSYIRSSLQGPREMVLMYVPLPYLPKWGSMVRGFIDGFFINSVTYPAGFWDFPVKGDVVNRTGVWSVFHDDWRAPGDIGGGVSVGQVAPYSGPTLLNRLAPPSFSDRAPFVQGLRAVLEASANASETCDTLVVLPTLSADVPLALAQLEQVGMHGNQGRPTRLLSLICGSNDYRAFGYPGGLEGGARHGACVEWQFRLVAYMAHMAGVLERGTQGERLFGNELASERLMTRTAFPPARMKRRADCGLYETLTAPRPLGTAAHGYPYAHPVCNYERGCGNASLPCSGRGVCKFPSAAENSKSGGVLDARFGWCVCHEGWAGALCEKPADDSPRFQRWVIIAGSLVVILLSSLLLFVMCKKLRAVSKAQLKKREVTARKRRPPAKGQPVAVVFTDIEGSTNLWEWDPEIMNHCLQIHHRVLRVLLSKHHGYESNTEGDAFEVVFHDASDALLWVLDAQMALLYPEELLRPTKNGSARTSWPEKLLLHPLGCEVRDDDGCILYRGLRVRMGIHVGVPENTYQHPNGRQRYLGEAMDVAKAIGDAPSQGGQVLMSMDAWAALETSSGQLGDLPIVVHNMGEHILGKDMPPMQLMEVLPQALHRRAPFEAIRSLEQVTPSFFDAPGSRSYVNDEAPVDYVAIMFTFVGGVSRLKRSPYFPAAINVLTGFVRDRLRKHHGYECEEKDGNFLLAFADAMDAALFSQELQVDAMDLPWPQGLLENDAAAEVPLLPLQVTSAECDVSPLEGRVRCPDAGGRYLFRGLRLKCGWYWGIPTRCLPHASTGRASYFGPLMNRAARIASAAANGQTLCNSDAVEALQAAIDALEPDITFTPLGRFSLKGISTSLELSEVSCSRTRGRTFPRPAQMARTTSSTPGQILTRRLSQTDGNWTPMETNRFLTRQETMMWGEQGPLSVGGSTAGGDGMLSSSKDDTGSACSSRRSSVNSDHMVPHAGDLAVPGTGRFRRMSTKQSAQAVAAMMTALQQAADGIPTNIEDFPPSPTAASAPPPPPAKRPGRVSLDSIAGLLDKPFHMLGSLAHRKVSPLPVPKYGQLKGTQKGKVYADKEAEGWDMSSTPESPKTRAGVAPDTVVRKMGWLNEASEPGPEKSDRTSASRPHVEIPMP